jgi:deoxyribodipyrimidine photo-lyase
VQDAETPGTDRAAYLEELIVRRELSDNFCAYTPGYDTPDAFPAWARASLDAHADDPRPYLYTRSQLEHAQTHDDLWNAAQREMRIRGKMHGYLRMYWAKKILEWSPTYTEALEAAQYLNDRYFLDGRDPNGYTGIAWSIGGVHDRPWFDRPIFGVVRYMNRAGCERKFDASAYIAWVDSLDEQA